MCYFIQRLLANKRAPLSQRRHGVKRSSPLSSRQSYFTPTTSCLPTLSPRASRGTSRRNSCRRARPSTPACCKWSPCAVGIGWAGSWRRPTRRTCVGRRRLSSRLGTWRSFPGRAPLVRLWWSGSGPGLEIEAVSLSVSKAEIVRWGCQMTYRS